MHTKWPFQPDLISRSPFFPAPHLYPDILSSPSKRGIACSTLRISVIFWWPRRERGVHTQKPNTKYRTRDRPFIRRAGNLRSLSRVNHFYVSIILWPNVSFYLKKKKKFFPRHQHPFFDLDLIYIII